MYACRYSVENAYLEEKEDTCNALGEMAENLGSSFLPYLDDCFREINILSEVSLHLLQLRVVSGSGCFLSKCLRLCLFLHRSCFRDRLNNCIIISRSPMKVSGRLPSGHCLGSARSGTSVLSTLKTQIVEVQCTYVCIP